MSGYDDSRDKSHPQAPSSLRNVSVQNQRRAGNPFMQTHSGMLPPQKTAPPAVVMRKADGTVAAPLPFTGIPADLAAAAFHPHIPAAAPPAPVQARGDVSDPSTSPDAGVQRSPVQLRRASKDDPSKWSSDSGKTLHVDRREVYSEAALIDHANTELAKAGKNGSLVELRKGTTKKHETHDLVKVVPTWIPKGTDSGQHGEVEKANALGGKDSHGKTGGDMALWADCGKSSSAVTGATAENNADRVGVYSKSGSETSQGTWNFHYAGVILKDGDDNVTLENYATGTPDEINRAWIHLMYGTIKPDGSADEDNTFHHDHLNTKTHGTKATSMTVRTEK